VELDDFKAVFKIEKLVVSKRKEDTRTRVSNGRIRNEHVCVGLTIEEAQSHNGRDGQ
jgi:hypothetical protein